MSCHATLSLACAAVILWISGASSALSDTRRVVVLYDERTDLPGMAAVNASFAATMTSSSRDTVEIYNEEMDLSRFASGAYLPLLRDHLRAKYASKKIDVVVAVMGPALDFLLNYGTTVFPGTPIVFCGIGKSDLNHRSLPPHVTGVLLKRAFSPTLDRALGLHPDTRQIVLVGGTGDYDSRLVEQARQEFQIYKDRLAFKDLTALPMPDVLKELSRLPPQTIVLYLSLFQDGAGTPFDPYQVAEKVSAAANAPVYGFVDGHVGRGIVGGHMYTVKAQGEEAARIVQKVLGGAKPSSLPLAEGAASRDMFDWRQLERWRIPLSRLPAGSEVLFRPASLWHDYRLEAAIALGLVVVQALLILGFLFEHHRRRRSQVALRASYREVRDLAGRLISARETERAAIARELHDDLSQKLAVLAIDVDMLEHDVAGVDGVAERVRGVADRARRIGADVHSLSHQLHPYNLAIQGLVPSLEGLCRELSAPNDLHIDFHHEPLPRPIPQETALGLFRIAQEALHNVVRHSGAVRAEVRLACVDHTLQLEVSDSGRGFTLGSVAAVGLGLVSMRERVQLVGGRLEIDSASGAGTRVRASIPLDGIDNARGDDTRFPSP